MKLGILFAAASIVCLGQPLPTASKLLTVKPGEPVQVGIECGEKRIEELGLPCTEASPCPVYLELSQAETVGDRVVVAGNLHTNNATLESILLVSDDGGVSWSENHSRIPSAVLDRIQFINFENGWTNGHLLQPLARDAFFLLTVDGGKTWRKSNIAGESLPGAIDDFWFDSRTHGLFIIERPFSDGNLRHEIWESNTGGQSWSVRQVDSKPIALGKPAPVQTARIRHDGGGKTHEIERNLNGKWVRVARVAVSAGQCKPAPQEEPAAQP